MKTPADLVHTLIDKVPWFDENEQSQAHALATDEWGPPTTENGNGDGDGDGDGNGEPDEATDTTG